MCHKTVALTYLKSATLPENKQIKTEETTCSKLSFKKRTEIALHGGIPVVKTFLNYRNKSNQYERRRKKDEN